MKNTLLSIVVLGIASVVTASSCRDIGGTGTQSAGQNVLKPKTSVLLIGNNGVQCVSAVPQPIKA